MRAADVEAAVAATGGSVLMCSSLATVVPLLHQLRKGRPFYLRWGMGVLIHALEEYQEARCRKR